jgi:hypothetical protein
MRSPLLSSLLCVFALLPPAAAQSRADSIAVARVVLADFGQRRPVFLEARRGLAGHVHDGGQPRDTLWLGSVANGSGAAGICDTLACTPPRQDDFRMIRLADPRFTAPDTAQLFAVLTVGSGAPGCRDEDRIGYDVALVKQGVTWVVAAKRERMQAWVAESLCFVRGRKQR